jgi:tetratricopeptide (TPR) repeat protein
MPDAVDVTDEPKIDELAPLPPEKNIMPNKPKPKTSVYDRYKDDDTQYDGRPSVENHYGKMPGPEGPFDIFKRDDVFEALMQHPETRAFSTDSGFIARINMIRACGQHEQQRTAQLAMSDPRIMKAMAALQGWGLKIEDNDVKKAERVGDMEKRDAVQMPNLEYAHQFKTCKASKEAGNECFKEGRYNDALACYLRVLNLGSEKLKHELAASKGELVDGKAPKLSLEGPLDPSLPYAEILSPRFYLRDGDGGLGQPRSVTTSVTTCVTPSVTTSVTTFEMEMVMAVSVSRDRGRHSTSARVTDDGGHFSHRCTIHSNCAAALLKLQRPAEALQSCEAAIRTKYDYDGHVQDVSKVCGANDHYRISSFARRSLPLRAPS